MLLERVETGIEIKDVGETTGTFIGYGSTFGNVDGGGDIVVKGAFSKSLKARTPKFLLHHDTRHPIGVFKSAKEDATGLLVEGQFNLEKQIARDAFSDLKMGALDGLSIGYRTIKASRDDRTGIRQIKEADLFEVSLVTFPMNEQARVAAIKSLSSQIKTIREFEDALRDVMGFSSQAAKAIASGGFKADLRDGADAQSAALMALAKQLKS